MCGYLELIIGPMFSGKTSRILEIYRKATYCNNTVYVLNHSFDDRYSNTEVVNHNNEKIPCMNYNKINDFINCVILINEGQFFEDIKDGVIKLVEHFKFNVYVCGLDGDFKQKPFGNFLELIPYCNKVEKLSSLCFNCKNGTEAPFTYRTSSHNEKQIMVGSQESYIPLCRKCYNSMSNNS